MTKEIEKIKESKEKMASLESSISLISSCHVIVP